VLTKLTSPAWSLWWPKSTSSSEPLQDKFKQYFEDEAIPDEDRPESAIPKSDDENADEKEEDGAAGKKSKKGAKGAKGKKAAGDTDADEKEEKKPKKGSKKAKVYSV
jgi:hypothetical protein